MQTILLLIAVSACSRPAENSAAAPPPLANVEPTQTQLSSPLQTDTELPSPTITQTATPTPAPTFTEEPSPQPTATLSPTPTVTPTYAILRAEVLQRANCRYGPGAPYLYKYGLVVGSNLEVIGCNDRGTWILVRAIGGDNPCWVNASLMEVQGDVMAVEPVYIDLPQSPYYAPPTGVSAARSGSQVTIFWNPISMRPGDETASPPYLVEAWLCQDGEVVFTPIGSYETTVVIEDEPGCSEPSHGRVFGVEKHGGYTRWVEIPWPEHE